ncbi:S4 domain-containing protein YaaA [Camelliibacillus cellulosilyticus]|uniref:S4 domain-containing protein YaaA n=1 Tax=Camelliibacillus cellulosilyticus TaxID=2174486 RepID=A0ABV9GRA5_9BACL
MAQAVLLEHDKDFITLGQLLKSVGLIDTGGQAKWFLSEYTTLVNGEPETRRGKKLIIGDKIDIAEHGTYIVSRNRSSS